MLKTLKKIGNSILSALLVCSLLTFVPVSAEENLINTSADTDITVADFSSQCTSSAIGEDAEATYVLDYNDNSYWHSDWRNSKTMPQHLTFDLAKVYNLSKISFLPRQGAQYPNGDIFKANVYVGTTQNNMSLVGTYEFEKDGYFLANRSEYKHIELNVFGQFVKIEAIETGGDQGQLNLFASMGEIRFYGNEAEPPRELTDLINEKANDVTVENYSSQCGGEGETYENGTGQAFATVDYNEDTYWHSDWNAHNGQKHTITYNLGKEYTLKDVTFLPRKGGRNGDIHKFEVYVGNNTDYTQNTLTGEYVFATSGTLTQGQWYRADILANGEFSGQYVTIRVTGSYGDSGNNQFASMGEIRFYGTEVIEEDGDEGFESNVDKTALGELIDFADSIIGTTNASQQYTVTSFAVYVEALENAIEVYDNDLAEEADVLVALNELNTAIEQLVEVESLRRNVEIAKENLPYFADMSDAWLTGYNEMIAEAEAVLAKSDLTAVEVEVAMERLNAIEVYADLCDAIAQAEATDTAGKTTASIEALQAAIDSAKAIRDNKASTYDELETAISVVLEKAEDLEDIVLNKDALNTALETAKAVYEANNENATYTVNSFASFKATYETANTLKDLTAKDTTQEAIDNVTQQLVNTYAQLVDLTVLKAAIAQSETLKAEDYTEESFGGNFFGALETAKDVLEDIDSSKEAVENAVTALAEATENLVSVVALRDLIKEVEDTNEALYTSASWQVFEDALIEARDVLAYGTTAEEIADAVTMLEEAYDGLVLKPEQDKDALNLAIASAKSTFEAGNANGVFTVNSFNTFVEAYNAAVALVENEEVEQDVIDAATQALEQAQNGLVDLGYLKDFIVYVEKYKAEDYTAGSYADFTATITNANVVVANPSASQAEVDQAVRNIENAVTNLVNITALKQAIVDANAVERALYTSASLATLDTALVNAETVLANANATVYEVAQAKNAITEAIENLQSKPVQDLAALNEAIASAKVIVDAGNEAGKYNEASWNALTQAYAQAQATANNDEATQTEIDAAKDTLVAAVENLVVVLADYSAVNAAIEAASALDANLYTNFDAVTTAINAVVRDLDITKQSEVDAMAKAINDAVAALEYKVADYSAVNAAIEAANALKDKVVNFEVVQQVIDSVVYDKNITEQAVVDGYASEILAAMENLVTIPEQVTNLVATSTNYKTITLTWDEVEGATYYEVYRRNTKTGLWIQLENATTNTYVISGVKTGLEYTYKVKAVKVLDDGTVVEGNESVETKGKAMLQGAPVLSATMEGSTRFVLNWSQVEGATRYIIYRKVENGTYKKILTLGADATTYTSNSMMPGTYFYIVKAARYDGSERVMSEDSNEVEVQSTTTTSQLEVAEESATTVRLTWTEVEGMKYYEVYASEANQDVYRRVKVQTTTTYISRSLKSGVTYNYKIRGYRINNEVKVYSAFSNVVTYTVK